MQVDFIKIPKRLEQLVGAIILLVISIIAGEIGFIIIEDYNPREAFYMESLIKVGCTFHSNGTVQLFINGALIKEELVTVSGFNFGTTDCYIGKDPSDSNTQFMGELHEISMYKRGEPTLSSTTLSPGYNDILF